MLLVSLYVLSERGRYYCLRVHSLNVIFFSLRNYLFSSNHPTTQQDRIRYKKKKLQYEHYGDTTRDDDLPGMITGSIGIHEDLLLKKPNQFAVK